MKGPVPGVIVTYWIPTAVLETTPQCGWTTAPTIFTSGFPLLAEVEGLTEIPCKLRAAAQGFLNAGTSMRLQDDGQRSLQYAEAHAYDIPMNMEYITEFLDWMCFVPSVPAPRVMYLSETDFFQWVFGIRDFSLGLAFAPTCSAAPVWPNCVGTWGPLYAKTGWAPQESKLAHSALLGFRALKAAEELGQYHSFTTPIDKMQLAYPSVSPRCFFVGEPQNSWEYGIDQQFNKLQHFVWVYWRFVLCCV
jgi:hypothetical protein